MRKYTFLTMLMLLCTAAARSRAQGYTWEPLSGNNAAQMARHFEGNIALQLAPATRRIPHALDFSRVQVYEMQAGDILYHLDLRSQDYFRFYDTSYWHSEKFYGQPVDTNVLGPQAMSQEAAEKIARDYMQAHYPDPAWLNKTNVTSHVDNGNHPGDTPFIPWYEFEFYQETDGVRIPAKCDVQIDTIYGKIVSFYGIHYPALISTVPNLSVDQAYASIFHNLGLSGSPTGKVELLVSIPDGMGMEQLVYKLCFYESVSGRLYQVTLDANNGVIWSIEKAHGGTTHANPVSPATLAWQAKLAQRPAVAKTVLTPLMGEAKAEINYPPLLVDGQPYLYVGYLCYGAKDVKLRYNGRDDIAIVSPERTARFSLHKAAYTLDGKTYALPAKPVIVQDRCYVPLCAAQQMMPFRIAYDAAKKQVRFDALPAATKTASTNAPNKEVVFGGKR